MSGHTKGPWTIYFYSDEHEYPGIESESLSIVVWGDKDDKQGVLGATRDEAIANARLIAAAPELLEACNDMLNFHAQVFVKGRPLTIDGVAIDHSLLNSAAEKAQRAVRKAEGREP